MDPEKIISETRMLSKDKRLDKLLQTVVREVKFFAEDQLRHIKNTAEIGLALSLHSDINVLFEKIVDQARAMANADGGALYTLDSDRTHLCFRILQYESMGIRMGGTSDFEITLPNVPLYIDPDDKRPNYSNVASHVAITGNIVNIADVYDYEGFDFSGMRSYDITMGYQSKSMLVIPLKNHEDKIIGVLQLQNAQDPDTGEVVAFSPEYVDLIRSLASQAAIALTNTQLIQEMKTLFNAFIQSIATAIDKKSPFTGDHIRRVVALTMMIAERIDETDHGPFAEVRFSDGELEELKIAAWMHDVGKITTPDHLIEKASKLQAPFDRIGLIETRFQLIAKTMETRFLRQKIEWMENGEADPERMRRQNEELMVALQKLDEDLEFIKACNKPSEYVKEEQVDRIRAIAEEKYLLYGKKHPFLTPDETENLSIRKGTLTEAERSIIEKHAQITYEILQKLPFPDHMNRVPIYAAGHHLKVDGKGYPRNLRTQNLPLQSRIMAVADIFEALTAKDRPYKSPMTLSQAVRILGILKRDRHIDPDIHDLFIESGLYREYAVKELRPDQIDDQID